MPGRASDTRESAVTVAMGRSDAAASAPLVGRPLLLARALWIIIAVIVLGMGIAAIPVRYERVRTLAPDLRAPEFRNLIPAGVSPETAAAADIVWVTSIFLAGWVGGSLLYLRGWRSIEVTLVSLTVILYVTSFTGLTAVYRTAGRPFTQSWLGLLATVHFFLGSTSAFAAPFWLPVGRFTSRWTAAFTACCIAAVGFLYFFVDFPRSHDLINIVGLPVVVTGVWVQASHYRRVANPLIRQQIKWVVIGIVTTSVGFLIWQLAWFVFGGESSLTARIAMIAARVLVNIAQAAIPACFAVAILRYGLWHVDLVINRSLVYGAVTTLLALVFVGGGLLLQRVLGQDRSSIAFAISTTAAVLLFNPARGHVQRFVDRRLYGFRFDLNELNRAQRVHSISTPGALTGRALGHYRILGVIGRGGMGEVYQGERDGRLFAIKVLPHELAQTDTRKWFERESHVLAAVDHPNIVKFYESGESDGVYYLVLDFIQGRELTDVLRERRRIPVGEVQLLLQDFAAALDYAHERGLVHRDIKPSNIMLRPKPDGAGSEAVLMDFGVAKMHDARTMATHTGAVGTISYMAPEQIMASKAIDHRADVYALGVTVYEMLTGDVPFKGSPAQVLFAHLQQRPPDPREFVPELPTGVVRSVIRALEKRPEDRFQSVREFALALGGIAA